MSDFHFQPLPSFPHDAVDAPRSPSDGPDYASWIQRVGAYLLDGIVLIIVTNVIAAATGHHDIFNTFHTYTVDGKTKLRPYGHEFEFYLVTSAVLIVVYSIAFLASSWQATPGMRVLGIHIASESDLGPIRLGRAAGRTALVIGVPLVLQLVVSVLGSLVLLVDLLWPLWDSRNQTLHDKVAKTVVLRRARVR